MGLGDWIEIGKGLLKMAAGKSEEGYVPQKAPWPQPAAGPAPATTAAPGIARARADEKLSEHFSLYELTVTNNAALQGKNRILTDEQVEKLRKVASLLEIARAILGTGVDAHSGYRCPELNGVTPGSASKSQHMVCEAADMSPAGPDTEASIEAAFAKLLEAAKAGKFQFGQLIIESAKRDYGRVFWIHISLGRPYRSQGRCGEVMRAAPDASGKMVYTKIEQIPQEVA